MRQGQHEVVALGPLSKGTPSFLLAHFLLLGSGLQALVRFGGLLGSRLVTGLWTFLGSVAVQSSYSLWSSFPSCQT